MIAFDADEHPRSLQLYGVDPATVGRGRADRSSSRTSPTTSTSTSAARSPRSPARAAGAALPYKRRLFESIVRAAVRQRRARCPVTVKMRIGIDDEHVTFLDAGRIAADAGAAAVALHARTARSTTRARPTGRAIARLRDALPAELPVLGNGDIFSAADALRMMAATGCDGVVVGRGCQGRPWLFGDLEAAFAGRPLPTPPTSARVDGDHAPPRRAALRRTWARTRASATCASTSPGTSRASRWARRRGGGSGMVESLDELDELLATLDPDQPFPADAEGPRGRQGSPGRVVLPEGWLDDPDDAAVPFGAELEHSGG